MDFYDKLRNARLNNPVKNKASQIGGAGEIMDEESLGTEQYITSDMGLANPPRSQLMQGGDSVAYVKNLLPKPLTTSRNEKSLLYFRPTFIGSGPAPRQFFGAMPDEGIKLAPSTINKLNNIDIKEFHRIMRMPMDKINKMGFVDRFTFLIKYIMEKAKEESSLRTVSMIDQLENSANELKGDILTDDEADRLSEMSYINRRGLSLSETKGLQTQRSQTSQDPNEMPLEIYLKITTALRELDPQLFTKPLKTLINNLVIPRYVNMEVLDLLMTFAPFDILYSKQIYTPTTSEEKRVPLLGIKKQKSVLTRMRSRRTRKARNLLYADLLNKEYGIGLSIGDRTDADIYGSESILGLVGEEINSVGTYSQYLEMYLETREGQIKELAERIAQRQVFQLPDEPEPIQSEEKAEVPITTTTQAMALNAIQGLIDQGKAELEQIPATERKGGVFEKARLAKIEELNELEQEVGKLLVRGTDEEIEKLRQRVKAVTTSKLR